jgi:hypothetical protein
MRTTFLSHEGATYALVSSSLHDGKLRRLGGEEIGSQSVPQPPVSDGKRAYFWSSSPGGGIVRFDGLKHQRFSGPIPLPAALAAGEGRFARVDYPRQRDEARSPAWSPDGKEIAYVRHSPRQLWLVNADGTDPHQIAAHAWAPDWSPDGTKLAYGAPHNNVVLANADGSDPQIVTSGEDAAWSPDGHELAVEDRGDIWIVSADGQSRRLLIHNASAPDWSPDGSRIVYDAGSNFRVTVANADGTGARSLGVTDSDATIDSGPEWSPDGSEIAYSGSSSVCEIRPDGSHKHCLPIVGNVGTYDPSWGPAPGQLVFSYEDDSTDYDPHLVIWPGNRQITMASPEWIWLSKDTGRTVAQINAGAPPLALAVSSRAVAALIHDPRIGWAVKIYKPRPRTVPLPSRPHTLLSAAGTTLVFQIGRTIETLDALRGSPHAVASTRGRTAVGLSIFGRRIAWADRTRVRILDLG